MLLESVKVMVNLWFISTVLVIVIVPVLLVRETWKDSESTYRS